MKKLKLFASFAILLIAGSVQAQSKYFLESYNQIGNPRNLNKEQDDFSVANNWESVLGDSANVGYSKVLNLPFNFKLGGTIFSQYKVASTGYITFSINETKIQRPKYRDELNLPSVNLPDYSLYIGGITTFEANDQVFVKTFGTAPNRQFWIKFQSFTPVHDSLGGSYATSAIVLEEGSQRIHFVDMKASFSDVATTKYLVHNYGIQISNTEAYTIGDKLGSFNNPIPNMQIKLHGFNGNQYQDNNYYTFFEGQQPQLDVKIGQRLDQSSLQQFQDALYVVYDLNKIGKDSISNIEIRHILTDDLGTVLKDTILTKSNLPFIQEHFTGVDTFKIAPFVGKIISLQTIIQKVNGKSDNNIQNDTLEMNRVLVQLQNPTGKQTHLFENIVSTDFNMVPLFENLLNQEVSNAKGALILMNYHYQDKLSGIIDSLGIMKTFGFNEVYSHVNSLNQNSGTISMTNRNSGSNRMDHTALVLNQWKNNQVNPKNSKATLDVSDLTYDSLKKRITGKIKFTASDYLLSTKIRLNAFLLEDNVRGNGAGYDQKINEKLLSDTNFQSEYFFGKTSPLNGYTHQNVVWSASNGFYGEKLSDFEIMFKPGDKWEWSFILPVPVVTKSFKFTAANVGENGTFEGLGKVADFKVVGVMYEDLQHSTNFGLANNQLQSGTWPVVVNAAQRKIWDVSSSVQKLAVVSKLGIYPNPAAGNVHLQTAENDGEIAQVRVCDLTGKSVQIQSGIGNQLNLDLSHIQSGIYFIEVVYQNKHKYTGKLVVH